MKSNSNDLCIFCISICITFWTPLVCVLVLDVCRMCGANTKGRGFLCGQVKIRMKQKLRVCVILWLELFFKTSIYLFFMFERTKSCAQRDAFIGFELWTYFLCTGWTMERNHKPSCLHCSVLPHHVGMEEALLKDLKDSTVEVKVTFKLL